ncbi:unnamed protein product [Brachionus calyciflorus]|uniref:CAF17 C-terminal domain-containing protein n=1 Tax=Brachionus calyciflorus TaxID=104777 RepID=A0A814KER7_9BILA|nr:unnamed protein product [Brachionus calyciflorus]
MFSNSKSNLLLILKQFSNQYASKKTFSVVSLSNYRTLINIKGEDAAKFLQNLTTNNIYTLNNEKPSQFAFILNNRGRIMYDTLIHLHPNDHQKHYLMELDSKYVEQALKYFKLFKIKKKVDLSLEQNLKLYSIFGDDKDVGFESALLNVKDPRYDGLGYRLITQQNIESNSDLRNYRKILYQNGVTENVEDYTQGSSIPLEYNIEFLNGVSFDKGCYLGQELVAKTHYTGVVRKRIMPFKLKQKIDESKFSKDNLILNKQTGQTVGKLKNLIDEFGIGMLRLANVDKNGIVLVDNDKNEHEIDVVIPKYWPLDDPLLKDLKKFD